MGKWINAVASRRDGSAWATTRTGVQVFGIESQPPASVPGWGFTHTQFSVDSGSAATTASNALKTQPMMQNQHIMGWGAENPQPSPGVWNLGALDSRMNFIKNSNGIPVITLCGAPDWMKGGTAGQTDWSKIEVAPLPSFFDEFASMCVTIAKRYPYVQYFQVWNEWKGFWNNTLNRWDYEGYTNLYNQVYDALKAANPNLKVGGPYNPIVSYPPGVASTVTGPWGTVDKRVLDGVNYWLANKRGADFFCLDATGGMQNGAPNEFIGVDRFSAITDWVKSRTNLPIWWAEWYVTPTQSGWTAAREIAVRVCAMIEMAAADSEVVLYWAPAPGASTTTLFTSAGQPKPMFTVHQNFISKFPPDISRNRIAPAAGIRGLQSSKGTVVVNTTNAPISATVSGQSVTLSAYETRWM